jgi:FlaA1/EpsC-like NDP-sugar epimerase
MISFLFNLSRKVKIFLAITADIFICFISISTSFSLRLEKFYIINLNDFYYYIFSSLLLIFLFNWQKLYFSLFRYVDQVSIIKIVKTYILYAVIISFILNFFNIFNIPRSIILIQSLIACCLSISLRTFISILFISLSKNKNYFFVKKIYIFGLNDFSFKITQILKQSGLYEILGIISEDKDKKFLKQEQLLGIKIFNKLDIEKIINTKDRFEIFFIIPDINSETEIIKKILNNNILIKQIPYIDKLDNFISLEKNLKNIQIEEILGRNQIKPIQELLIKNNKKNNILVSGGAGSIGSEIIKKILFLDPKEIFIIDNNEFELFNLEQEINGILKKKKINIKVCYYLADICDKNFLISFFNENKIDTVYHCAAYKHVPLLEKNIISAFKNNLLGTENICEISLINNVKNFVFISTDKAINPINIMGLTKKLSELIIYKNYLNFLQNKKLNTKFAVVRFGNVIGSRGSVIPIFKNQINSGGPITITDLNMKRFFMSLSEASELVIQAGAITQDFDTFVLNMGEEINILDLAEKMANLNGLKIKRNSDDYGDIDIEIIGTRQGEKIKEDLYFDKSLVNTDHPKISKYKTQFKIPENFDEIINKIKSYISSNKSKDLEEYIFKNIYNFS